MEYSENVLIFDDRIDGHHLEYIHHLYIGCEFSLNSKFIFLLPIEFASLRNNYFWPERENVEIILLSNRQMNSLNNTSGLRRSLILSNIISEAIKNYSANKLFLISLMSVVPFIAFYRNVNVKISGIIYLIYLYRWRSSSIVIKFLDTSKYLFLSKLPIFHNVFLLNDSNAPVVLNKLYKTGKFKFLPDPVSFIGRVDKAGLRDSLCIDSSAIVYSHFGALDERKGTINILKAILSSNLTLEDNIYFIFAGRINHTIEDEFSELIEQIKNKTRIYVFNAYVESEFIASLCAASNWLLIPYKNVAQSSGVLSHAAVYNVPVVSPKQGLLGKLVKRYKLGYLLDDSSVTSLKNFFELGLRSHPITDLNEYVLKRSSVDFSRCILNAMR